MGASCLSEEIAYWHQNPQAGNPSGEGTTEAIEGDIEMKEKEEKLEIMRGSGNIFRDFGHPDAELRHLKCQLAAEIISVLDDNNWSVRHAQKETGFDAGDFSRIRNADFRGITLDKMVRMLEKLNLRMKPMFEKIPRRSERKTNKDAHVLV